MKAPSMGIWVGAALLAALTVVTERAVQTRLRDPGALAAWRNIGGCGASGGGVAAGAGKWIGRSVSGGLVDLELLQNKTLGGDYDYDATSVSFTFHKPTWPNYTAGLSLGWKQSNFEYIGYKTNGDPIPPLLIEDAGLADLGLTVNRLFGDENNHSLGLSIGLPTGQDDIKRLYQKSTAGGPDDIRWLSPFDQPGTGLYTAGLTYEYTRDRDWGLFIFGGSYTAAFAYQDMSCRDTTTSTAINDQVINCQTLAPSPLTWKLWDLKHQPWGGNPASWQQSYGVPGTGATGADDFSLYAHVGRKEEHSVQSAGLTLTVPTAPTYWWDYGPGLGKVSQRYRSYDITLKLSLGLEISNPNFPAFIAFGIPWSLNQMSDRGRFTAPMNYLGTVGVRGTFF